MSLRTFFFLIAQYVPRPGNTRDRYCLHRNLQEVMRQISTHANVVIDETKACVKSSRNRRERGGELGAGRRLMGSDGGGGGRAKT